MNVTPLFGGSTLRVRLSNRFGTRAITFDSIYIGKQQDGAALVPGSSRQVRFRGKRKVRIPRGEEVRSDRVRLSYSAFERLAVSLYARRITGGVTQHFTAAQRSFFTPAGAGDLGAEESGTAFTQSTTSRFFVTGIDVRAPKRVAAIVTFGDSLTDGLQARSVPFRQAGIDDDARYPDFLARRLLDQKQPRYSVLNAGISGNRILTGGRYIFGRRALSRYRADVGALSGATDVIVLEGINDFGAIPSATAKDVIDGLRRLVRRLQRLRPSSSGRKHFNVLVGTLLPARNAPAFGDGSALANARRELVNRYIRTSGIGDGVVDFDAALRDPANPSQLKPLYDSGDHLHPSSAGYKAMADAVPITRVRGSGC
jgi:lysophospholipase L1-like esterase